MSTKKEKCLCCKEWNPACFCICHMTEEPEVPSHSQTEIIEWEKNLNYNSTDLGEMGKFIRVEYAKNILQKAITTAVAKRELEIAEDAEKKTCPNKGKENCICSQCYMPTTPEKKCCFNCGIGSDGCANKDCPCHQSESIEWEKDLSFRFDTWLKLYPGTPTIGEIEEWWLESLRITIASAVEASMKKLVPWIDENIGVSSKAIFLWMSAGIIPGVFEAPSDSGDRRRCVVLLKARPEWIPRLKEIESLHLTGTSNGEKVEPWNEQIPLIRSIINPSKE